MALELWPSLNNVPVGNGPIFTTTDADIVLTELGQFSNSSVTLPSADERAVRAMAPFTLLEVVQPGVGTLTAGYVLNPRQQVSDNGDGTITLELQPLTVELVWELTGRGWIAQNALSVIAARLGALVPGWAGRFTGAGTADDLTVNVSLDNPTVVGGFLQVAKQFAQYARQGVDAAGAPARALEMGQFGATPTVTLVSADDGDTVLMQDNQSIRLVVTVDYAPGDVSALVNLAVPFGGGSGDALVTLERLWRIVNDPTYANYGRYGTDADSIARTGLPSVWTEYDPDHPISDPANPATGVTQWKFTDLAGNDAGQLFAVSVGAADANGVVPLTVRDAVGAVIGAVRTDIVATLWQGANWTRTPTLDGHFDYPCVALASYDTYGRKMGRFVDSGLTYTDNNPANQEYTARALYLETIANFARVAHPHETFACTAPGLGRPTRAGDLIAVAYRRVSAGEAGAVVEMDVAEDLRVTRVVRAFRGDAVPVDTYTLSNLGRFDETDASAQADMARTLIAFQLRQDTAIAPFPIGPVAADVDAETPMEIPLIIPAELFRWHRCVLRVDFQPYRGTGTTAENVAGTPIAFAVPHGSHSLAGAGVTDTGLTGTTDGFDLVQTGVDNDAVVKIVVSNDGGTQPIGQRLNAELLTNQGSVGAAWRLSSGAVPDGTPLGANMKINFVKAKTKSAFTAAVNKAVSVATNLIATLPVHVHPINQQINKGPLPVDCTVAIDGLALTSGLLVSSGSRNADGTFPGSFQVDDLSAFINKPGQTVMLTLSAGTNAGNPLGVGRFQATLVAFGEWGGLAAAGTIAS